MPEKRAFAQGLDDLRAKTGKFIALIIGLMSLPFAIHNALNNQPIQAALNFFLSIVLLWSAIRVHRAGRFKFHGFEVFLSTTAVILYSVLIYKEIGIYWSYMLVFALYCIFSGRMSIIVGVAYSIIIVIAAAQVLEVSHVVRIASSYLLINCFGYMFNLLLEKQDAKLETMAKVDRLTGVFNRHYLGDINQGIRSRSARHPVVCTVALMDIDHFKQVNDDLGHQQGDKTLHKIAELLTTRTRQSDLVFRYGGEEFLILAQDSHLQDAAVLAEELRQQIAKERLCPGRTITASFGLAELQQDEDIEACIDRADQALYQAKKAGRDRVVAATEAAFE